MPLRLPKSLKRMLARRSGSVAPSNAPHLHANTNANIAVAATESQYSPPPTPPVRHQRSFPLPSSTGRRRLSLRRRRGANIIDAEQQAELAEAERDRARTAAKHNPAPNPARHHEIQLLMQRPPPVRNNSRPAPLLPRRPHEIAEGYYADFGIQSPAPAATHRVSNANRTPYESVNTPSSSRSSQRGSPRGSGSSRRSTKKRGIKPPGNPDFSNLGDSSEV